MKKLFLVRHAKSSWANPGMKDFDRPLNDRGERDVVFMAELFARSGKRPELLITSPALRALTTASQFKTSLNIPDKQFLENKTIYEAGIGTLAGIVNKLPAETNSVMLFGHNPGFSMLLYHFTAENIDMPTCAIAEIAFDTNLWEYCIEGSGQLLSYEFPRRYFPKT